MIRAITIASLIAPLVGCGPLVTPMVVRLTEENQARVDESWVNMFSPPQRLDRTLLLDTLVMNQMHERGVDELRLVSKKRVGDALVVMEVDFNRLEPDFDAFTVTYINAPGMEARRERYTFDEVRERLQFLARDDEVLAEPGLTEEQLQQLALESQARRAARMKEIEAATQPAVTP